MRSYGCCSIEEPIRDGRSMARKEVRRYASRSPAEARARWLSLLLAHGADPNSEVDSGGSAMWGAPPELRPLLVAHGGNLRAYESVWLDDDERVIRRAKEDPASVDGSVFTAVVTKGKRDLLLRLLEAGVRVPPVLTDCQGYLLGTHGHASYAAGARNDAGPHELATPDAAAPRLSWTGYDGCGRRTGSGPP